MAAFLYEFEWDSVKANANRNKHGLDFERAATAFLDPLAVTIPDHEHNETEARWITPGKDAGGQYVLVIHTFEWLTDEPGRVRLISARRPTRAEIREYEEHT
ncbi:MAG: BrnT family toxin [Bryobacterales bacterium]|nr:BrnT family toxin [Bryobacterales bacterium]